VKPRAGDRSETPLLPALLPFLLFHPSAKLSAAPSVLSQTANEETPVGA